MVRIYCHARPYGFFLMNKIRIFGYCSFLLVFMSGCYKNPFTDPFAYAPKASSKVWKPTSKESRKIRDIDPVASILVPGEEDFISLGDLFDIALNNSPNTAKSWEEARESAANYSSSLSAYLPAVSFDANYDAIKQGSVFNGRYVSSEVQHWGPKLKVSYLLWDSGERRFTTEHAFQLLQQSNWQHNEEVQKVMQNVALTYYDFLYAKALLETYEADLLNAEETYKAAQEKSLSGIFDATDEMQAKTNFLKKKVSVTTQIAQVKNTFVDVLSVIGIPASASFHLGSFPEKEPLNPVDMTEDELVSVAKQLRPDLLATKAEIMAAEAEVNKKKTDLLPKINFQGQGGEQWYNNGTNDKGNYLFQVDLTFPIFTGFYYINQIKRARAQLEKDVAIYREIELKMLKEVKQAFNDFVMSKQEIIDTQSYLDAAQVEFNAMFERYKMGIVDILDLLSSQAFLSDARALYVQSKKTYYMSIIDIAFATGMLTNSCPWTVEDDE